MRNAGTVDTNPRIRYSSSVNLCTWHKKALDNLIIDPLTHSTSHIRDPTDRIEDPTEGEP